MVGQHLGRRSRELLFRRSPHSPSPPTLLAPGGIGTKIRPHLWHCSYRWPSSVCSRSHRCRTSTHLILNMGTAIGLLDAEGVHEPFDDRSWLAVALSWESVVRDQFTVIRGRCSIMEGRIPAP